MTGEELFFRYAFPCADDKLSLNRISKRQYDRLVKFREKSLIPPRFLLKVCFPNAFKAIRDLARKIQFETWSFENVALYWRVGHQKEGDCGVNIIIIKEANQKKVVDLDSKQYFNIYDLPLEAGQKVYTHRRCIIETVPHD